MTQNAEPTAEEIERWTRNLLKPTHAAAINSGEKKMIAKVLGTQTAAEHFLRKTGGLAPARATHVHGREGRYRPIEVRIRIDYWERHISAFPEWIIERYENGRLVTTHQGNDWQKRDELLIKLRAAGITCTPVTVAGLTPAPIQGRMRDKPKPSTARAGIMARLGKLTTEDLEEDY